MSGSFSNSRLSTLDECPRRYRLRYVEKVKEAFQSAEAFLGTMVHEAIQWLYLEREASRDVPEDVLVERYRETWRQRRDPSVRIVQDGGTFDSFLAEGEEMLRRHHRGGFVRDRLTTLEIEQKITLTLSAGDASASYVGYIDRLAKDADGRFHVIDYKTSKSVPASFDEAGLQVRGYGLAVLETLGGPEVALRYEYLRHDRALEETMPRSRTAEIAESIGRRIARALQAEQAGDFPARPSGLCRWCGYRETCDASPFHATGPQAEPSTSCPLCGGELRLRVSSRSALVACVRFPDCLHAREAAEDDAARFEKALVR